MFTHGKSLGENFSKEIMSMEPESINKLMNRAATNIKPYTKQRIVYQNHNLLNHHKEQTGQDLTPRDRDSSELSCRRSKSMSSPPSSP